MIRKIKLTKINMNSVTDNSKNISVSINVIILLKFMLKDGNTLK